MPWIFLTLMLANIVYFGWSFISVSQAPVRTLSVSVQQEGKPIVLLSERKQMPVTTPEAGKLDQGETPLEKGALLAVKEAPVAQCFNVGPFPSSVVAQGFGSNLSAKGFSVRIESRKAEGKDYWIYVPPFTNRAKAEERLRELRSKGVESFVVAEGAFVNAISLGHFSKKESAESFREKLLLAGVTAEYREMANTGAAGWVYAAPGSAKRDLKAAIEAEILRNPSLRKEAAACEE
jgi:cell division protein FtsN